MSGIDSQIDNFFDNSHVPEDKPEPQEGALDLSAHKLIKEEEEIVVNMDGGVGGSWETKPLSPVEYYAQRLSRKVETEHTHVDLFAPQPEPNTPSFVGIHKPSTENESTQMTEEDFGNRLRMVEKRISDVALTMGEVKTLAEDTIVSGIGQGGDGQTPGSGEVLLSRMDDVDIYDLLPGQALVWDGFGWRNVNVAGGGTTGYVESVEAGAGIQVVGSNAAGNVVVSLDASTSDINLNAEGDAIVALAASVSVNIPTLIKQEDVNIAFTSLIEDIDTRLIPIESGQSTEYLLLTGGTMTGGIEMPADQITRTDHVITEEYADLRYAQLTGATFTGQVELDGSPLVITARDGAFVTRVLTGADQAGSAMTYNGQIQNGNHVVNKGHLDTEIATLRTDLEQQITNLDESNLTSHILSYDYSSSASPSAGQFTSSDVNPGNVTSFDFNAVDSNNRIFPELYPGDLLSVRPAAQGSDVQNYKVTTGPTPDSIIVTAEATTAVDFVPGESYVVTLTHAFEGFATKNYVDSNAVAKSGDTMTGQLILDGPPQSNLAAATKAYVDSQGSTGDFLPLNGGTMKGAIIMGGTSTTTRRIGTSSTSNSLRLGTGSGADLEFTNTGVIKLGKDITCNNYKITDLETLDDTASGASTKDAVNRNYVAQKIASLKTELNGSYLPLSGGKLTGRLEIDSGTSETLRVKSTVSTASATTIATFRNSSNAHIFRVLANGSVKAGASTSSPFMASANDDLITKKYFDDNQTSGTAAETVNTTTPPNTRTRGTMLMTSDGQLYVYT